MKKILSMHSKLFKWEKNRKEIKRLQKELKELERERIHVPHIEEIRAVEHEGETYYNAKDLTIAMKQYAYMSSINSASVFAFIRMFTIELITAVRGEK